MWHFYVPWCTGKNRKLTLHSYFTCARQLSVARVVHSAHRQSLIPFLVGFFFCHQKLVVIVYICAFFYVSPFLELKLHRNKTHLNELNRFRNNAFKKYCVLLFLLIFRALFLFYLLNLIECKSKPDHQKQRNNELDHSILCRKKISIEFREWEAIILQAWITHVIDC